MTYPKFRLSTADRAALLEDYLPYAEIVVLPTPLPALPITCRDLDDAVFLALAITAGVPLVSGDGDLAVMRETAPVEVLTAAELWGCLPA